MGKEFFYEKDGKKEDADLHNPILENKEASDAADRALIRRAVANGMDPKEAERLFSSGAKT
jgi:hypothetical protein